MGRTLIQLFVDGLSIGLVYTLMSSGFNLVMAVPNIIFIAFGQFYMLGAFVVWYLETSVAVQLFLRRCHRGRRHGDTRGSQLSVRLSAAPVPQESVPDEHHRRRRA